MHNFAKGPLLDSVHTQDGKAKAAVATDDRHLPLCILLLRAACGQRGRGAEARARSGVAAAQRPRAPATVRCSSAAADGRSFPRRHWRPLVRLIPCPWLPPDRGAVVSLLGARCLFPTDRPKGNAAVGRENERENALDKTQTGPKAEGFFPPWQGCRCSCPSLSRTHTRAFSHPRSLAQLVGRQATAHMGTVWSILSHLSAALQQDGDALPPAPSSPPISTPVRVRASVRDRWDGLHLATANACRAKRQLGGAVLGQAMGQVGQDAGPTHAKRVAHRDGAAVNVEPGAAPCV